MIELESEAFIALLNTTITISPETIKLICAEFALFFCVGGAALLMIYSDRI